MIPVTQDEILQAISEAITKLPTTEGPLGITTAEYAAQITGGNAHRARAEIVRLLQAGVLERVKVFRISELSGARTRVPGFRPK